MVTILLLLGFAVVGALIWGYEKFKQDSYIAKAIDGFDGNSNFVTEECEAVLAQLRKRVGIKFNRYGNYLLLPDGQKIGVVVGSMESFQRYSDLNFGPTPTEWKILKGVVAKLYSDL
jgi:hypothetical protein